VGSRAGLAAIEAIIDASGAAPRIEKMLPAGVRHRQLRARTLLTGMMLALDDRRPAYLTEIRAALTSLPEADQVRLGVTEDWHGRPHQLTYRQTEHTCRLIAKALSKDSPDGAPSDDLQAACGQLLEASICCAALKMPMRAAFTMPMGNRTIRAGAWARCRLRRQGAGLEGSQAPDTAARTAAEGGDGCQRASRSREWRWRVSRPGTGSAAGRGSAP
jgi:hypothetical protein